MNVFRTDATGFIGLPLHYFDLPFHHPKPCTLPLRARSSLLRFLSI